WLPCVDWDGLAFRARKGDQVEVTGYFEFRTYTDKKDGQDKTVRQIVVTNFRIRKTKIRHEAD
ncbi:MAG: single-stranded DNA-binding protein, partial [Acidobacteria bacterium]|nr:single-stranded DNA-binding protein [Acidobacteriota bacterium]